MKECRECPGKQCLNFSEGRTETKFNFGVTIIRKERIEDCPAHRLNAANLSNVRQIHEHEREAK